MSVLARTNLLPTKDMAMIRFRSEDGTGVLATITDAETGADIQKMLGIEYGATITLGHVVTAECKLSMVEVDVVAQQTTFATKHPVSGRFEPVRAIEFRDGTRVEIAEDGTPSISLSY